MDAPVTLKKRTPVVLLLLVSLLLIVLALAVTSKLVATEIRWDESTLRHVLQKEIAQVQALAAEPQVVAAVQQQNAAALSKADILRRDLAWSSGDSTLPLKQQMLGSEITHFLKQQVERSRVYSEMILTDRQGANVATWPLSSDYWQGDEAKWREVALFGRESYLSPIAHDLSSDSNVVQLAVPVLDDQHTIGVLIVSIRLSHVFGNQLRHQ